MQATKRIYMINIFSFYLCLLVLKRGNHIVANCYNVILLFGENNHNKILRICHAELSAFMIGHCAAFGKFFEVGISAAVFLNFLCLFETFFSFPVGIVLKNEKCVSWIASDDSFFHPENVLSVECIERRKTNSPSYEST